MKILKFSIYLKKNLPLTRLHCLDPYNKTYNLFLWHFKIVEFSEYAKPLSWQVIKLNQSLKRLSTSSSLISIFTFFLQALLKGWKCWDLMIGKGPFVLEKKIGRRQGAETTNCQKRQGRGNPKTPALSLSHPRKSLNLAVSEPFFF